MKNLSYQIGFVCSLVQLLAACAYEIQDDALSIAGETPNDTRVASATEALRVGWGPIDGYTWLINGMTRARNSRRVYAWYSDGWVCRGNQYNGDAVLFGPDAQMADVCANEVYQYIAPHAPGGSLANIFAIGTSYASGHTITWYSNATYSEGTSDHLSRYVGALRFTLPRKPVSQGGGFFAMADLIEAENAPDSKWYFYWRSGDYLNGGKIFRTIGSAANAEAFSPATEAVFAAGHGRILGITWFTNCPDISCSPWSSFLEVYYEDGRLVWTNNSLNLDLED